MVFADHVELVVLAQEHMHVTHTFTTHVSSIVQMQHATQMQQVTLKIKCLRCRFVGHEFRRHAGAAGFKWGRWLPPVLDTAPLSIGHHIFLLVEVAYVQSVGLNSAMRVEKYLVYACVCLCVCECACT